jgi:hypothetical protein
MRTHAIIHPHLKGENIMLRIVVLAAALALTATVSSGGAFAQAKKEKAICTMDACMATCHKTGGQPRLCPAYCTKRLNERKAAGQC